MPRFWVSWYSGNYADEGCTTPPFQFWDSGHRYRPEATQRKGKQDKFYPRDDMTLCAVIDASSEDEIWPVVRQFFPDAEQRFCNQRADDFQPGDRFPDFEGRTSLAAGAGAGTS